MDSASTEVVIAIVILDDIVQHAHNIRTCNGMYKHAYVAATMTSCSGNNSGAVQPAISKRVPGRSLRIHYMANFDD